MTNFENSFVEEVTFKNSESYSISDDQCSPMFTTAKTPKRVRFLTRLSLRLNHLREQKMKHNFQDAKK